MKNIIIESIKIHGIPKDGTDINQITWLIVKKPQVLVSYLHEVDGTNVREFTPVRLPLNNNKTNEEIIQYILDEISK